MKRRRAEETGGWGEGKRWSQKWDRKEKKQDCIAIPESVGCVKLIGSILGVHWSLVVQCKP